MLTLVTVTVGLLALELLLPELFPKLVDGVGVGLGVAVGTGVGLGLVGVGVGVGVGKGEGAVAEGLTDRSGRAEAITVGSGVG